MKKNDDIIAIYSRKSKFTGKGDSIGNQIELCREYIAKYFGDEYLERIAVYEDEGFSGGNTNRPQFKMLMEDAQKRKFKAIVVYRLDRISRNIGDFAHLIEELGDLNIAFVSIKEQFDTDTPMGRAMMYIASVFSQLERETIAERIRDNMHELAKTGRWLGGVTPTGFTSCGQETVTVDGKKRKSFHLQLLPEEAENVKAIYDLFLSRESLTGVETELLARRMKTKNGKDYTRYTLKAILENPVYLTADEDAYEYLAGKGCNIFNARDDFDGQHGLLVYNRTDQNKKNATKILPESEWIVAVGQHPGLISSKSWIKVQQLLDRNTTNAYRKERKTEALLSGLLFCKCGSQMYPKETGRVLPDGEKVFSYVCNMKLRSKGERCKSRNLNGNMLDKAIVDQLKRLPEDREGFIKQLERSRKAWASNESQVEVQLSALRSEKKELEKKLEGLMDSLADIGTGATRKLIIDRMEEMQASMTQVQSKIAELEQVSEQGAMNELEFGLLQEMLGKFANRFDDMGADEKRAAVRMLVRKVVWDGENAHVVLFGVEDDEVDLPSVEEILQKTDKESSEPLGNQEKRCYGGDSK